MVPTQGYNMNYRILQTPGYVVILHEMGCVPRFVEKERRPPLRHQGIRSGGNLRVFETSLRPW